MDILAANILLKERPNPNIFALLWESSAVLLTFAFPTLAAALQIQRLL